MCYYSFRSQKSQISPSGLLSCEQFQWRILSLGRSSFQKPPASFGFGSLPPSSKPAARSSNLFLSVQLLHLHIVFLPSWDALEKPSTNAIPDLAFVTCFFFFLLFGNYQVKFSYDFSTHSEYLGARFFPLIIMST